MSIAARDTAWKVIDCRHREISIFDQVRWQPMKALRYLLVVLFPSLLAAQADTLHLLDEGGNWSANIVSSRVDSTFPAERR